MPSEEAGGKLDGGGLPLPCLAGARLKHWLLLASLPKPLCPISKLCLVQPPTEAEQKWGNSWPAQSHPQLIVLLLYQTQSFVGENVMPKKMSCKHCCRNLMMTMGERR